MAGKRSGGQGKECNKQYAIVVGEGKKIKLI